MDFTATQCSIWARRRPPLHNVPLKKELFINIPTPRPPPHPTPPQHEMFCIRITQEGVSFCDEL